MDEPFETWHPIPGFEGAYEASSLGRIRSLPRLTSRGIRGGQLIKTPMKRRGRRYAYLCADGDCTAYKLARLVAMAFHGMPKEGQVAIHLDGDPLNNLATNIAWSDVFPNRNTNKTHCLNGHLFDEANTMIIAKTGSRRCRKCQNERNREYRESRRNK